MPYTEEQLHDMLNIDGPPTIRQLALQNLHNREQEAKGTGAEPTAPTMLGQQEEEDEGEVYEEQTHPEENAIEQPDNKDEEGAAAVESVRLHSTAPRPTRSTPWVPILLIAIGVACIAMIMARCKS